MSKGMTKVGVVSLVLALLAPVGAAMAQADAVSSRMDAYRVTKSADGKEALEPAKAIKPGEVIEYQITYENSDAAKPVADLKINAPIPTGTNYVEDSAKTAVKSQIRFSIDSGKSWQQAPLMRKHADGKGEEVVPASQYSNLQWLAQEPLKQGHSQKYSYCRYPGAGSSSIASDGS